MQNDFQIIDELPSGNEDLLVARLCDIDTANHGPWTPVQKRRHVEMLCISAVVLICATLLQTPDGHHVALPCMANTPFPEICISKAWFGVSCPGCGLTRSFISMMHGHLANAVFYNRVGPILFLFVLLQFPYRIFGLLTQQDYPLGRRVAQGTVWLLIGLLLGNWGISVFGVLR